MLHAKSLAKQSGVVLVLVAEVTGGTTRDLKALPGHLAALPGHLAALLGHLAALPGHLRAFVASAGLTQAFENHRRTGRAADPWSGLWSGLAAWDHCG